MKAKLPPICNYSGTEDRKMEDRKMFAPLCRRRRATRCGTPSRHRQLPWHDVKRHLSVFHSAMRNHDKFDPLVDHFSVLAMDLDCLLRLSEVIWGNWLL
jgi:hypothetical protein